MESVGIRELRQRASELLRRVEAGESIEITDRGRPIAQLAPLGERGVRARLRSSGEITPATGSLAELPAPLPIPVGHEPPSIWLERLRSGER
jgi:prevent-host-death family protein